MDEIAKYHASNAKRQRKLRAFDKVANPEDIRSELAVSRLLLQESLEAGNTGLANQLLATVGRLVHTRTIVKKANDQFIARAELRRFCNRMCEVVTQAISGRFTGWEDAIDEIAQALVNVVDSEPKTLEVSE